MKDLARHIEADEVNKFYCVECFKGYPVPCKCGGLIHAEFSDYDDANDDVLLLLECDQCGSSYQEFEGAREEP